MKTVGFPITNKENELRRALIPADIKKIDNPGYLFFETGYGKHLGFSDEDFLSEGANIVSHDETLKKDIVCDPKIGDADYLEKLNNQIIFGWVHAVQNKDITDTIIKGKLTAYAWEDMYNSGRHIFYRNNEIAGEAAILHAYQLFGEMPYNTKVAILGNGNTARGAFKILSNLGADVTNYNRKTEKLFRNDLDKYDVIVNAVLWDTSRKDHIIYEKDLERMRFNSLIIDISCDEKGAIETSIPTTIEEPVYATKGIIHYVVDHTPSLFFKTASSSISEANASYLNQLITGKHTKTLSDSLIIENGIILDNRINVFQNR